MSRIHSLLPRLAFVVAPIVVALLAGAFLWWKRPYVVPASESIFDVVAGRWAWVDDDDRCTHHWHDISFSRDHQVMTIANSEPYENSDGKLDSLAVYDIREHTPSWIRAMMRGEQRLTEDSQLVIWDLVLRSRDRYAWHRTDWPFGGFTRPIERCP